NDLRGMAQIIIAKHRQGATGDVLLRFRGEFTRFANPEDSSFDRIPGPEGGEIRGSRLNGDEPLPPPPDDRPPF
ncbi:MAG: replicative DNA helicase, partial [Prevotella sp.]|nr:replicative DNA helicase [Prevotella sp.]